MPGHDLRRLYPPWRYFRKIPWKGLQIVTSTVSRLTWHVLLLDTNDPSAETDLGFIVQRRMKKLFTPIMMLVSAAALAQGQSANLPRYEFFGGYSVNADYIPNRSVLLALDQKVSPFFSLGSGPYGFEFSVKRYVRNGLGLKTDFSGYYDPFPPNKGIYCQSSGCFNGLNGKATSKTFYLTSGAEWKIRRDKRFAPFVQALGGIVHSRAKFTLTGSDTGPPLSGGIILGSSTSALTGTISYSALSPTLAGPSRPAQGLTCA